MTKGDSVLALIDTDPGIDDALALLYAWGSPQIVGLFLLAALLFCLFAWVERRAAEPIMPPDLFRDRIIAVGLVVVVLAGMAMYGLIVYLPLFVQGVLGKPLDLDELRSLLGDPQGPTPSEHHAMA